MLWLIGVVRVLYLYFIGTVWGLSGEIFSLKTYNMKELQSVFYSLTFSLKTFFFSQLLCLCSYCCVSVGQCISG